MEYRVSVIIPNYNGMDFFRPCLTSVMAQTRPADRIIVVDNGSVDGSPDAIELEFPSVELIRYTENTGFCGAVNAGIKASEDCDYVILLNNDTEADLHFVEELLKGIAGKEKVFSCQAKMLKMSDPSLCDDAGDYYCSLGWAFARGRGKPESLYQRPAALFSSCAGAAIYSMKILKEIGIFDENHFAYLEDTDIGWRARIHGYRNIFLPRAKVLHVGSASTGSVYNDFKVKNTSRNSIYLIYKNMPTPQIILNLPLFIPGFLIKAAFFTLKGFGNEYIGGIRKGFALCRKGREEGRKILYNKKNFWNYVQIQMELWVNCCRRLHN
ncbi:MAG: glycosyltransferase family 2 protein [Lachnospiraceae bacterium]|nr:glycosyltransferase family 2 protein [Lachnospiraceae bacterium]